MHGYWQRPEATDEALDQDGWFRTGDIASMQADGFIRICDRVKDMILVSGFNVYPNEVEAVVYAHPDVVECAVGWRVADEKTRRGGQAVSWCPAIRQLDEELPAQLLPRAANGLQGAALSWSFANGVAEIQRGQGPAPGVARLDTGPSQQWCRATLIRCNSHRPLEDQLAVADDAEHPGRSRSPVHWTGRSDRTCRAQ